MMKYKNLFIDLDDTLWDTYHNNKECLEEIYTDHHFDRYYASFEAFFAIYWPHNELLWRQYRAGEIDRQTLIIDRFRYMLRPMGIEDTQSVLVERLPRSAGQETAQLRPGSLLHPDDSLGRCRNTKTP